MAEDLWKRTRAGHFAKWVQCAVKGGAPGGIGDANGDACRDVPEPCGEGFELRGREAAAETKDEWCGKRPRQPFDELSQEEPDPGVVHAFGAHDEDGLRRIEQSDSGPDGCNPEPFERLTGCAG